MGDIPIMTFLVPGPPVPAARVRVVRRRPGERPRGITPPRTESYEKRVGIYTLRAMAAATWPRNGEGPYGVRLFIYREADRGDLDNFVKAITDGMSRAGVWCNDKRVHYLEARMFVQRAAPCAQVSVWRLP